ncbi:MAG: segregation/condensation protein A [Polyangiaceae bacterium]
MTERSPVTDAPVSDAPVGGYSVSLPTFEGPLDLLLHLCQKHELDILDIPIGFVTEKYLEYLRLMQMMSLDVAAEYLLMAATLAHIKSKMLLPQVPSEQQDEEAAEEEDPREALIRRLLEYQKYKQAAAELNDRPTGNDVFLRGAPIEHVTNETEGPPPIAEVSLFALMDAFQRVLERSKVRITHDVVTDRLSITDRINELVDVLREKRRAEFVELFQTAQTKFDLVITFLALLEMTKLRMTRLFQTDPLAPLYVELSSGDGPLPTIDAEEEKDAAAPQDAAEADAEHPASESDGELAPEANEEIAPEPAPADSDPEPAPAPPSDREPAPAPVPEDPALESDREPAQAPTPEPTPAPTSGPGASEVEGVDAADTMITSHDSAEAEPPAAGDPSE